MKRLLFGILFIIIMSGCAVSESDIQERKEEMHLIGNRITYLTQEETRLKNSIKNLKTAVDSLKITVAEKSGKKVYYILTLEIRQRRVLPLLDLENAVKDEINKFTMDIPVDKDMYDKVSKEQKLADNFRIGSLILSGTFSKWEVTVKNKKKQVYKP